VFTKLKDAHAELRTAITELETETRRHEPDEASLSNARLKLTRASSRRRALIDQEILPTVRAAAPKRWPKAWSSCAIQWSSNDS